VSRLAAALAARAQLGAAGRVGASSYHRITRRIDNGFAVGGIIAAPGNPLIVRIGAGTPTLRAFSYRTRTGAPGRAMVAA
jgi:hypothetical protein